MFKEIGKYIESVNKFKGIDWGAYVAVKNLDRKEEKEVEDEDQNDDGAETDSYSDECDSDEDYGDEGEDSDGSKKSKKKGNISDEEINLSQ
jgi:hypothetical protein